VEKRQRLKLERKLKQQEASKMARLKLKTLREMNDQDLADKLSELKADLAKLKLEKSKGTLKKQTANIKWLRRDIARMHTLLNERKSSKK
jgi:large subunit ribosomal protein L29